MSKIEMISQKIAFKISTKLCLNNDKEEVLAYGAFVLFQTIISIAMVAIFGMIFNVLMEAIIISFTASFLRKSSGGAHATSPMNCAIIGMIIFGILALLVKSYAINISYSYLVVLVILAFIYALYIMYNYSPVGTSTKPLKNETTRKRLKGVSIKIVISLFGLSILFIILYLQTLQIQFINIVVCISVGAVWQSITMVSLGHKIIDGLDKVLGGTNKLTRRKK